jgi:hypothetical protein
MNIVAQQHYLVTRPEVVKSEAVKGISTFILASLDSDPKLDHSRCIQKAITGEEVAVDALVTPDLIATSCTQPLCRAPQPIRHSAYQSPKHYLPTVMRSRATSAG